MFTPMALCLAFAAGTVSAQTLELVREARFGAIEGTTALTRVGDVAVTNGLHVFVAQPVERVVRVFDPGGRLTRVIGRPGSGPGEFRNISAIGIAGDTLWVADGSSRRMSFFTLAGEFLDSFQWNTGTLTPNQYLADGSLIAGWLFEGPDALPPAWPVLQVSRMGTVLDTLFVLPSPHIRVRGANVSLPFSRLPRFRVAPGGLELVKVRENAPVQDGRGQFVVEWMPVGGAVTAAREIGYRPTPVPPAIMQSVRQNYTNAGAPAETVRDIEQALRSVRFMPPVSDITVGNDGAVWLARERNGATRPWCRVERSNRARIACVTLPSSSNVVAADAGRIWVRELDEWHVEYVVRYSYSLR